MLHKRVIDILCSALIVLAIFVSSQALYQIWQDKNAYAAQENCDYYYEKARQIIEFGSGFGKYDESAASTSTAYSLLYKNCLARQKNR